MVLFCKDTVEDVRKLLDRSQKVRIAVAYWGTKAVETLRLNNLRNCDVEIICDLTSGGCNPHEIDRMRKTLGKDRVLTCDNLHAKVWITESGAIVGSSNASANGLSLEGAETARLIEANVQVKEPEVLAAINKWYVTSVQNKARQITNADIKLALINWKRRRQSRPIVEQSLLDALRKDPTVVADRDDIQVWVYPFTEPNSWAKKELRQKRVELQTKNISFWQDVSRNDAQPGDWVLEFDSSNKNRPKFDGIYRVLQDDPFRKTRYGTILFCRGVKDADGLRIGRKDRDELQKAAQKACGKKDRWDGTLFQFANKFVSVGET